MLAGRIWNLNLNAVRVSHQSNLSDSDCYDRDPEIVQVCVAQWVESCE